LLQPVPNEQRLESAEAQALSNPVANAVERVEDLTREASKAAF